MEWTTNLKKAIAYIETHLLDDIDGYDVAEQVHISSFYFQKGFSLLTGYSISEYIRYRRLYLSALDIANNEDKVIDIAYKYGYETPESFTKAFTRFHGVSPLILKKDIKKIKPFLPLKISIKITGGNSMDYKIEKMDSFKVIGFKISVNMDDSYKEIPEFWQKTFKKYQAKDYSKDVLDAFERNNIGEYGICFDDNPATKHFSYMIAGNYHGEKIPEGMSVVEIPASEWAKFRCVGPMPGALQSVNTEIFKTWLPGNPEWDMSSSLNIEWYSDMDSDSPDYESGIWLPVMHK